MRRTVLLLLVTATLATSSAAVAIPPALLIWADTGIGQALSVPLEASRDGSWFVERFEYETAGFRIRLADVRLDPDALISYALGVVDFGAPSAFAFSFYTPITPVGAPNLVQAGVVGGLVDATGDGIALTPLQAALQCAELGMPAPLTSMGADVGEAFAAPSVGQPAVYLYGPHVAGPNAGPGPGPWTGMNVAVEFTLSGHGDVAAFTGFARLREQVVPVPEASSAVLLGLGLLGLIAGLRGRRSR